jgi:YHS domain-containing protein
MIHRRSLFALALLALPTLAVQAGEYFEKDGLALRGHDPVAYFTEGKPVKGDPQFKHHWDEGLYLFASAKHRDMFAADPEKYAPQFGGYCTGSMARGVKNEGHPEAWIISGGRLYVFGSPDSQAAAKQRANALADPGFMQARIPKAEQNWRKRI